MTKRALRILGPVAWAAALACTPGSETASGSPNDSRGPTETRVGAESDARFTDPVRVSPDRYRVLETAPGVRVLAAEWPAGVKDEPHSHPIGIWYSLTDMSLRIETPSSPPLRRRISAGDTGIQAPILLHSVQNIGDQAAEILMFEIEPRSSAPIESQGSSAPRAISVANHFRLLEQHAGYRLVLATFEPDQRDRLHSHPAVLWFALTEVHLRMAEPGSEPVEVHLEAGESRHTEAVAAHTVSNLGASVARLLLLEVP